MRDLKNSEGVNPPTSNFPFGEIVNGSGGISGTSINRRIFGDIINGFQNIASLGSGFNGSIDSSASIDGGIHRYQLSDNMGYLVERILKNQYTDRFNEKPDINLLFEGYEMNKASFLETIVFGIAVNLPDALSCVFDGIKYVVNTTVDTINIYDSVSSKTSTILVQSAVLFSLDNQNIYSIISDGNDVFLNLNNQPFFTDEGKGFSFCPTLNEQFLFIWNLSDDIVFYKINSIGSPSIITTIENSPDDIIQSSDYSESIYLLIDSSPQKMFLISTDGIKESETILDYEYHTFRIIGDYVYMFRRGESKIDIYDLSMNLIRTRTINAEIKFISHGSTNGRFIGININDDWGIIQKTI